MFLKVHSVFPEMNTLEAWSPEGWAVYAVCSVRPILGFLETKALY
jgi:hypothetical protein